MATDKEYEVFKAVYDEELQRYTDLSTRANLYFTIISFLLGTIILKFEDVAKTLALFHVPRWYYFVIGLLLALALVCTVAAVCIRRYETTMDLLDEYECMGPPKRKTPMPEAVFLERRLIDFAQATKTNVAQNNRMAQWLHWTAYLVLAAVIVQCVVLGVALCTNLQYHLKRR